MAAMPRIYPGNSGGFPVTEDGQPIGVNTVELIIEKFEGLGFAIHFSLVCSEFGGFLRNKLYYQYSREMFLGIHRAFVIPLRLTENVSHISC